jgi:hypothetical protein
MSPREVQGLQALAMKNGGSLTINPETGLPEAGFLDKLLPTIIGAGISFFSGGMINPMQAAAIVGGIQTVRTGDIGKGISAGLGAYGGAGMTAGLTTAGAGVLSGDATALAAQQAGNLAGEQATQMGLSDAARQQMIDEASNATARVATDASPFDKLSAGAKSVADNPMGYATKDNFKYLAAGAAPILADQAVKSNLPTTTTKPGMIRPYSYDPYGGTYTAGTPYETVPTKAADGGLMGMNNGGYSPGQLDFTQSSEPVMRMAEGGIAGYADGGPLDVNNPIYQYFAKPETQALLASGNDRAIADALQKNDWKLADVAAATGTQDRLADYSTRFVNAVNTPTTSAEEFQAMTSDVGLQNEALANAVKNSGMSAAAQYAATHRLDDTAGITGAPQAAQNFYNSYGYQAGNAPGDQGGLEGLYSNIGYAADRLQGQINAGKLTVEQAQNLSLAEMERLGINQADIKAATGKSFGNLFTPKEIVKPIVTNMGTTIIPGVNDYGLGGSGTSGRLESVYGPALPPGVSGAGITTVNPNGTITTRPNIPNIPEGGFTGTTSLRDAFTKGGGDLGVNKNLFVPKTLDELNARYKNTGGSKQAMDYLTGKTPYDPTPYTPTGEIQKPYWESVGRFPAQEKNKNKKYLFKNGKYELNPDFVEPSYVLAAKKAAADKETTKADAAAGKSINVLDAQGNTEPAYLRDDGLYHTSGGNKFDEKGAQVAAGGGLAALTMAGGGMSSQFNLGSYSDGGRLLRGPGDGVSDSIPATIGNKRPARLADGEFVVPARIVSELGNGSTEAGARKLYAMMDRVQAARKGSIGKGKVAKNSRADKYLPA